MGKEVGRRDHDHKMKSIYMSSYLLIHSEFVFYWLLFLLLLYVLGINVLEILCLHVIDIYCSFVSFMCTAKGSLT